MVLAGDFALAPPPPGHRIERERLVREVNWARFDDCQAAWARGKRRSHPSNSGKSGKGVFACLLDAEDDDVVRLLAFKLRQHLMKLESGYDKNAGNKKINNNHALKVQSTIELEGGSENGSEASEA